ncbi:hypothetical protein BSL78_02785 [Apostichopus japonicus]|uniref:Uncharacterized protein n=1 Tax=Stichopus japonicus TaxID=307972 RepID=A0A2G8LJ65_STIJA|nr:hypothetical protein BSL78_02785 [Apostichopus japonicus]
MVARIFKYAILIALVAILIYFLTQEENQNAMRDALQDVTRTDAWKTFKKTWQKSYKKTQQLFTNAQNGKLSVEIGTSLDASSRSFLGVGLADLQGHLKSLDSGTAGTILLTVWLLLGYFLYKVTSTGPRSS